MLFFFEKGNMHPEYPAPHLKSLAGKRRQVWSGRARKTTGGLRKRDLVENRRGKIVSRKKSIAGRRASKALDLWRECLHEAAIANNQPFQIAAKGTVVYRYAKRRYNERIVQGEFTIRRSGSISSGRTTVRRATGHRAVRRASGRTTVRGASGRIASGRRASGRATGRRASGRRAVRRASGCATGRRASGRIASGRRASGRRATGRRVTSGEGRSTTATGGSMIASGGRSTAGATDNGPSDCAICMESSDAPRKHCQCGHSFHARCLDRWLQTHDTCPLCRCVCLGSGT